MTTDNTTGGTDDLSALRERIYTALNNQGGVMAATDAVMDVIRPVLERLGERIEDAETDAQTQRLRVIDYKTVLKRATKRAGRYRTAWWSARLRAQSMTRNAEDWMEVAKGAGKRADQAEQELAALQQLIDQWPDKHVKLRLLGETGDPPCADWCQRCAIERADKAEAERDQLTYERRLLYIARMTLDLVAAGGLERWDEARKGAEDVAQRIVDEIGHSVTDEPALGPSFRAEIARLKTALHAATKAIHDAEFQLKCEDPGAAWEKLGDWHRGHGYQGDGEEDCAHCTALLAAIDQTGDQP